MTLDPLAIAGRALVAVGVVAGGVVAWRLGGGAEAYAPPPRPASVASSAEAPAHGASSSGEYEVAVRLVEIASDARFDLPRADAAKAVMKAHWRQQRLPFVPVSGDAARFVSSVALRTSAHETPAAMPVGKDEKAWAPNARVWTMNEGSFDQRESLVAPGAGTIAFRVDVPQGATLTFAEGTLNATSDATVFVVSVVDAKGVLTEVHRHALPPSAARRWTDVRCDLSAFAGQNVELRLTTEVEPTSEAPRVPVRRSAPGHDVLATPSVPVALWGNPTIFARTTPHVPFNVLWIVVDALRPDVIASFHDDAEDAAKQAARWPPLEALLPKVPGLVPEIDDLVRRGVRFTHAYSAGSWTRPGTLAMLSGARSSELGVDATAWIIPPAEASRFYASDPPLLPLVLRRHHVATRAFVNDYFMVGYTPVGVDMGFERVADHRYRTHDTNAITEDVTRWIKENKDTRFFAFVSYRSPHEPYEPPPKHLEKVPGPPAGPKDRMARLYMAEASKDDEAIGALMRTVDETGLRDRTIVVLTADHGETMSSAHAGTSGLDKTPIRYHHAVGNYEETTKVPIVIVAPGALPEGREVKARVRSTDLAPTVLDLLGVEAHPRMSGKSLVALAKGQPEAEERVVVSEGRGSRAIIHGRYRLLAREGAARIVVQGGKTRATDFELYDLVDDPGERHDLAASQPDVVAEMKARLEAALSNAPVAGGRAPVAQADEQRPPVLHLRFAGGPQPRRVSGTIRIGDEKIRAKTYDVIPVGLGRDAFHHEDGRVDVALRTNADAPVGFDVVVEPSGTPITWELWLDDKPWPEDAVFGGPFGLLAPALRQGVASDAARLVAFASSMPTIDARRDVGLFVARERRGSGAAE